MNSHLIISCCCDLTWVNIVMSCGIEHISPCSIFGNWTFKSKLKEYVLSQCFLYCTVLNLQNSVHGFINNPHQRAIYHFQSELGNNYYRGRFQKRKPYCEKFVNAYFFWWYGSIKTHFIFPRSPLSSDGCLLYV